MSWRLGLMSLRAKQLHFYNFHGITSWKINWSLDKDANGRYNNETE
jgi:hypothetical protein